MVLRRRRSAARRVRNTFGMLDIGEGGRLRGRGRLSGRFRRKALPSIAGAVT
jgi:hypothetical protein